jgi:phosphate starvation-inducible protein PhoH and related proteins
MKNKLKDGTVKTKDTSPYVDKKRAKVTIDLTMRELPWTDKQKQFFELALNKNTKILIVKGVAGTSKTLLSVACALKKIQEKKSSEIYYSRVPVESSIHGIGYIKGTTEEKMGPYIQPLVDKLNELLPDPQVKALLNDNRIHGLPLGFLRGLNISNATFIMDEAQNCRVEDFLLVMSRMANFSNLFVLGDAQQSDIRNSGFEKVFHLFDNDAAKEKGIYTFQFGKEDIVRSEVLSFIIEAFESLRKTN